MNKTIEEIKNLLKDSNFNNNTTIELIGNGYASSAYKLSNNTEEFIALTPKPDCISPPNYPYYFSILKTLENINYKHSPRAIFINPEQTIIVMSLVPGEAIRWVNDQDDDTQKKAIDLLITALIDLRRARYEDCNTIYKELSGKDLEVNTLQKNVDYYLRKWFEMALEADPDKEITDWIQPKAEKCIEFAKDAEPSKNITLVHGDTSEGNVLLTKDFRINLIDWDTSTYNQYPESWDDYGIGYLFNHVQIFINNKNYALSKVSELLNMPPVEIQEVIFKVQEMIKLQDIMWAFMMNARAKTGEIKDDPGKFMKIAQERISNYKDVFERNSFLN